MCQEYLEKWGLGRLAVARGVLASGPSGAGRLAVQLPS